MIELDPRTTALVLIDLQDSILNQPRAPRSGTEIVATAKKLAQAFRDKKASVIMVHVGFAPDLADGPPQNVDKKIQRPPGPFPADFDKFAEGVVQSGDIVVKKRQWGAFYGTDLELHLRRRGIKTIVLGGIATNLGVESTARDAWERGFDIVFAEDTMTSLSAEMHSFAIANIFPSIGRVSSSGDISLKA